MECVGFRDREGCIGGSQKDLVVFKVKDKQEDNSTTSCVELKATKGMLTKSSVVFETMFRSGFREGTVPAVVQLNDTCEGHFTEFLRYMHSGEANLNAGNAAGLLYLGHKYLVEPLKQLIYHFLYSQLNDDNFDVILELSNLLGDAEFDALVMLYYRLNARKVLRSDSFVHLSKEALLKVVSVDKVNIKEIEVFRGCMRWLDAQMATMTKERQLESEVLQEVRSEDCFLHKPLPTRRQVLGDEVVKNIRFPCMTQKDFNEVLTHEEDLLTAREVAEIKQCLRKPTLYSWTDIVSLPRQTLWETCVDRSDSMMTSGKVPLDCVSFQTTCRLFLTGVGLQGRKNMDAVQVVVSEITASTTQSLLQTEAILQTNCTTPKKIAFEKPVRLQPANNYRINAVYFTGEKTMKPAGEKSDGAAYKLVQASLKCEELLFPAADPLEPTYPGIPHIYFVKL